MKQSKNFCFTPNAMKFTLVLPILKERLDPKFGEDWTTEYEDIDPRICQKSSKSIDFGRNLGQMTIHIFIVSWSIFTKLEI